MVYGVVHRLMLVLVGIEKERISEKDRFGFSAFFYFWSEIVQNSDSE